MTRRLPKYVSEHEDRHGKMRARFRRKGQASYYFKAVPWTADFMREYQACLDKTAAPEIVVAQERSRAGTFTALIALYYQTPQFTGLRPSTQATYRGILERLRQKHGEKLVAVIERKHVKAIIGAMSSTPAAANNLLDRLKALMDLAIEECIRRDDPTARVRGFKKEGPGFHTWTEDDIAKFEARHPIGSKARLALALMLFTGQRRSDAIAMGWSSVDGTRIRVSQQKTDARLEIPMHSVLRRVIGETPRDGATFLATAYGKPFTAAGFGNWFRDRCNEAGLPHCSAHGLRKAAARRLAEAGCGNQQIKAITGHKTDKEVARYTAAADQARLALQAMAAAYGEDGSEVSNLEGRLDNQADNPLNLQDN